MVFTLDMLVGAVKILKVGWPVIKDAVQGGKLTVQNEAGQSMLLAELEPHILAAEDARDTTSGHVHDRIEQRHEP